MDEIDVSKVKELWRKEGKDLKKPEIYFAVSRNKLYYVFRDDSYIISMIPKNCNVTYALPKKYCKIMEDKNGEKYYKFDNPNLLIGISCIGTKTKYENFIINNIIVDPTC